jgi:hypothetical protein
LLVSSVAFTQDLVGTGSAARTEDAGNKAGYISAMGSTAKIAASES